MKYTIVSRQDEVSIATSTYLHEVLLENKIERDDENPRLIIVVGGDGTFLVATHKYLDIISDCLIVGIHTGTLGFFADYDTSEIDKLVDDIINGTPEVHSKSMLEIEVVGNEGHEERRYFAFNELRIENVIKTQILKVWINKTYLETFRGTGLCVSTQPGSTGYNRSLRGAIIQDTLELMQMTEITGIHHRLFQSLQVPLILDRSAEIMMKSDSFDEAILCYDHLSVKIDHARHIICRLSDKKINFARYREQNYIQRIKALF